MFFNFIRQIFLEIIVLAQNVLPSKMYSADEYARIGLVLLLIYLSMYIFFSRKR